MGKMPRQVIIIEGEIAAGKTKLVGALAERLTSEGYRVCTIYEPVAEWSRIGVIAKFYENIIRWAYSFQTYVYTSRLRAILAAVAAMPDADVYLLERSPATDRVFMAVSERLMDPVELEMYREWCDVHDRLLPFSLSEATAIYLKTSLGTCMTRLAARARAGEIVQPAPVDGAAAGAAGQGVSVEYQARLRTAHEAFFRGDTRSEFATLPPCPYRGVVEIGADIADGNFRDPGFERERILDAVLARYRAAAGTPPLLQRAQTAESMEGTDHDV
jgi:deoxyadenosine/deoxycytidine kinase